MFRIESRWDFSCLALILLTGIVLRVSYVGEPPRYDESFTYLTFARYSLVHVLTFYPAPNNHILHSALVWLSCRMLGNSLFALRLPVLLAGIAVIPLMYITARRMGGRIAGLLGSGLVAIAGPFVLYSVNARGYMLQAALLLIMLYTASEILDGGPEGYWAVFSIAAIAGFWVAPTMLYSYLVAAGWLFWAGGFRILKPLAASAIAIAIAVVALYIPVVIVSGADALLNNRWIQPLAPPEFRARGSSVSARVDGFHPRRRSSAIRNFRLLGRCPQRIVQHARTS